MQHFISLFAQLPPPRSNAPKNNFANRKKNNDKASNRGGARCELCPTYRYYPLYGIDQGHLQSHSQAMAGRSKHRASRELSWSSRQTRSLFVHRQSRHTDKGEINTKPPAVFYAWKVLSRRKLFIAALTSYRCPSRSRGTSSSTIERMP